MAFFHIAFLLISVSAGPAFASDEGVIGIRYREEPEGRIVVGVTPGGGAEAAGLTAGDRIVSVDGTEYAAGGDVASFLGEVGSTVTLEVVAPFSSAQREVSVTRQERSSTPDKVQERLPKPIARFGASLREGRKRPARDAAIALVESNFADRDPEEAIGRYLLRAARIHPKAATAVLDVFMGIERTEPGFHYRLGEALFFLDRDNEAVVHLQRALDAWPADLASNLGHRGRVEEMLVNALWDSDQKQEAIDRTRALSRVREVPHLVKKVGMADPTPMDVWHINLPPEDEIETTLLDGSTWRLSEHKGKPVALVFWASWCGPCKKELPALAELKREREDWPVEFLAVSLDTKDADKAVRQLAKKWDLPFPVTRDGSLGKRYEIPGLPSLRVIGPEGSIRIKTKGYSKDSVKHLSERLDQLVAEAQKESTGEGLAFARAWSTGKVSLRSAAFVEGVRGIGSAMGQVAVGVRNEGARVAPLSEGAVVGGLEQEESRRFHGSTLVAWFGGPVAAGHSWVRARTPDDEERWFVSTPSPVQAMEVSADQLWVAMEHGLVVLGADGQVVHNFDVNAVDIASAADGGIWAVDGEERLRIGPDGTALLRDEAMGGWRIAGDGTWVSKGFNDLLVGRYGPNGEQRVIALREDGTIMGVDGDGAPALRIQLEDEVQPYIAAGDLDGDGHDELLISSKDRGVATVEMEIP
jgi:thiol-disulfide isomerase/thioredoxin